MITQASATQADFYREFIMGRDAFDPREHGVDLDNRAFTDLMVDEFNTHTRGEVSIDEFLLHPREALRFCDQTRWKHNFLYLPDDIILRSILNRRKRPEGSNKRAPCMT